MSSSPIWSVRRNLTLSQGEPLTIRVPVVSDTGRKSEREVEIALAADNIDPAGLQLQVRPEPGASLLVGAGRFLPEQGRRSFTLLNTGVDSFVDVEVRLPSWGPNRTELEFRAYDL